MDFKYLYFTVREGGLLHETKLPMQELQPNIQGGGGLVREGGIANCWDYTVL